MNIVESIKQHKKVLIALAALAALAVVAVLAASYYIIKPYQQHVFLLQDVPTQDVGIVLGAGVTRDGKPYNELKARLDAAAEALEKGVVKKLVLSGDNRFYDYNEPNVMKQYLVEQGVAEEKLFPDYGGRSTYESCERAAKIFNVQKAVIFSAGSHLPRAIYLCRHFGVESYGVSSGIEANNSTRRELLARVKAVYNVNVRGEPTVLGDPINIE